MKRGDKVHIGCQFIPGTNIPVKEIFPDSVGIVRNVSSTTVLLCNPHVTDSACANRDIPLTQPWGFKRSDIFMDVPQTENKDIRDVKNLFESSIQNL